MIIQTFRFMPFASRAGETVVGLRFPHNEPFIAALKASLARHKAEAVDPARNIQQPGGWQPKSRCWFVEEGVWMRVGNDIRSAVQGQIDLHFVWIDRPADVVHHGPPVIDDSVTVDLEYEIAVKLTRPVPVGAEVNDFNELSQALQDWMLEYADGGGEIVTMSAGPLKTGTAVDASERFQHPGGRR